MRDDIQQALADLGRAAERAAAPVGFEGIRRRARRRRQAQTLSVVGLCVVAAAAGVGIDQAVGPDQTVGPVHHGSPHPPPPTTAPTTAPTHDPTRKDASPPQRSARQIVQSPRSFVVASTVAPQDAAQAATLWELPPAGPKAQFALTTTGDGYQHVSYVPVPSSYGRDCNDVRAVGHREFWLSCSRRQLLVGSDGAVTVPTGSAPSAQMPSDAVLVAQPQLTGKGADWGWFDSDGVWHPMNAPGAAWLVHAPDGRIWGLDYGMRYGSQSLIWSTDGGRTWSRRALPGPPPSHTSNAYEIVPTAVPDQMVLARGTAETVFVPHSILMFGSSGQQLQRNPLDTGGASMDGAVVTPNGSLVMELYNGSNGNSGLYRAPVENWADLRKVMDLPTDAAGRPAGSLWMGNSIDSSGRRPVVWAVFTSGVLATSTDDGQTWTIRSIR